MHILLRVSLSLYTIAATSTGCPKKRTNKTNKMAKHGRLVNVPKVPHKDKVGYVRGAFEQKIIF